MGEEGIHRQHRVDDPRGINVSLRSASSRELIGLLKMFPKDAALHRSLADWLAQNQKTATAAETYKKSAQLYLDQGKILSAIAAKLRQWGQVRPSPQDVRALYSQIHRCRPGTHPVGDFFIRLEYPGLAAVLSVMQLFPAASGQVVKKFGTVEDYLFFVVSGALTSTWFVPMPATGIGASGQTTTLRENDIFGNVFPIEKENTSPSFIKAVLRSELIRIPKKPLATVCRRNPGLIKALERLFEKGARPDGLAGFRANRPDNRRALSVKLAVHLHVLPTGTPPLVLEGQSNNISVGGACVVLVPPHTAKLPPTVTGLDSKIHVSLPNDSVTMSIVGRVAWVHPAIVDGKVSMVLGIKFKQMTPQMIGYLIVFSEILKSMA